MPHQIDLSVIIVSYNTAEFLVTCLRSVLTQTGASYEICVVDNASADHSVDVVHKQFPQVRLIASPENLGFAKANNLAARDTKGKFIYYLNPDTEVRPGCFAAILRFMEANDSIGMAGTKLLYPDHTPQGSVEENYPGHRHTNNELSGLPGRIAWLLGASLIARRDVVEQIKGFNEKFFLYGEDIDLSIKVRQAGWKLGFIPEAEVIHWEGKSERHTQPLEVLQKKLAAEALFYRLHYTPATIGRICRANIRQARWRLITLPFERLLSKNKTAVTAKLNRYRLRFDFFQTLATTNLPPTLL
ncbi:MAG: glycosyltransferase family 2 protein [Desulfoarculaceae bacterium]|nr:glycosyltransferase family 2 protein [Desulfoarculaceae bacterium]